MRSLYTGDIAGSQSRPSIFQKSQFRERLQKEISRNEKNPERNKRYEWFTPLPEPPRNLTNPKPRPTLKLISEHTGLPSVAHYYQRYSNPNHESKAHNKSAVLTASGRLSMDSQSDPYFPHKYHNVSENFTKLASGNRIWNDNPSLMVELPSPQKSYFPRWG